MNFANRWRSDDAGSGRRRILLSTKRVNLSQLALRKFHLFTALLGIGLIGLNGEMSDGLCCDLGNGFRTNRSGEGLMLAKARSEVVVEFHLLEWKLSDCFGS